MSQNLQREPVKLSTSKLLWRRVKSLYELKGLDHIVIANRSRQNLLKMRLKDVLISTTDPYWVRAARHYDVIKHALGLDLPLPEHGAEYPDLLEKQAE